MSNSGAPTTTTSSSNGSSGCLQYIPVAYVVLTDLPGWAIALLVFFAICSLVSLAVFIEEIVFLTRRLKRGEQLNRTLWIIVQYPIYTVTAFLAVLIPRSGSLINLVANLFFAIAKYNLSELLITYVGGREGMWDVLGESQEISLRTPPICCVCVCLPTVKLTKKSFEHINNLVTQFLVIRPLVLFIAAVLWTNDNLIPGDIAVNNAFIYLAVVNLCSTLLAMWSVMITMKAFAPYIDARHKISGKVHCVQVVMIVTSGLNILAGILVSTNVVKCTSLLNSVARGDQLYHMMLIVASCILGIAARVSYRTEGDGHELINNTDETMLTNTARLSAGDAPKQNYSSVASSP